MRQNAQDILSHPGAADYQEFLDDLKTRLSEDGAYGLLEALVNRGCVRNAPQGFYRRYGSVRSVPGPPREWLLQRC